LDYVAVFEALVSLSPDPFGKKEPPKDLVPIDIQISNIGEAPAHGIRAYLEFPRECELFERVQVVALGMPIVSTTFKPTRGGLFVEPDTCEVWAWMGILGNDLIARKFNEVYVRFPAKEQEYKIMGSITQHNFPKENFEFTIVVKPEFEEKIEYVNEAQAKSEEDVQSED